jgi:hypothetical protein
LDLIFDGLKRENNQKGKASEKYMKELLTGLLQCYRKHNQEDICRTLPLQFEDWINLLKERIQEEFYQHYIMICREIDTLYTEKNPIYYQIYSHLLSSLFKRCRKEIEISINFDCI